LRKEEDLDMLFDLLEDDATNKDKLKRIKQIIDK
jgi:hypothetical protein